MIKIKDKHDIDSVKQFIDIGYPQNIDYLDELLSWTADSNWPIASEIYDYFLKLGEKEVERVLRFVGNCDLDWRYNLLEHLISRYNLEILRLCKEKLVYWAKSPGSCESEIVALEILVNNKLISDSEIQQIIDKNIEVYKLYISLMENLSRKL